MKKKVAILGSTGSIGKQTLEVLDFFSDQYEIFAISGNKNLETLNEQIQKYKPAKIGIFDEGINLELVDIQDNEELLLGSTGICQLASHPLVDIVVIAIPGSSSILPTWAAVAAGKKIGLASKEAMVMVGPLIISLAVETGATILPIDSEVGSIWLGLQGENVASVKKLYITCSGGAFHGYKTEEFINANLDDVLKHPTWSMGRKITVDSATLMNKALEVIETYYLFNLRLDQIEVILHPESIVHSMIEYLDGNIKANIGSRDMKLFIQSAITYPNRLQGPAKTLNWTSIPPLTFEEVNLNSIPSLDLAYKVCQLGGTYPAVLCSANDEAVKMFLKGNINFQQIMELIVQVIDQHTSVKEPELQDIIDVDSWAKSAIKQLIFSR